MSAGKRACMKDAFTYCSDFIPNHEQVAECLIANQERISPACREMLTHYVRPTASN